MACIIHKESITTDGKLTSPIDLTSWKTLLKAAQIRNYQPLLDIAQNLEEDEVPEVLYHRQCRSLFTLKRDIDKILQTEKESIESNEPPLKRRSIRGESSASRVYEKDCIFCDEDKYIKGTRTREKLRKCLELRCDDSVRLAALRKNDEKILAVASRDIVAAEAQYHPSCYKDYTRPPKKAKSSGSASTSCTEDDVKYQAVESNAYEQLFQFIRNDLFPKPRVMKLVTLTYQLVSTMKMFGVDVVKDSTKKHIVRKIEKEFGSSINVLNISHKLDLVYPSSLSIESLVKDNFMLTEKLEKLTSTSESDMSLVQQAGVILNSSVKEYEKTSPTKCPPDPSSVNKEHVMLPHLLEEFLMVLLEGGKMQLSDKTKRLVYSLGQDILFCVSKGNLQTPKHVLLASSVRSLTGNVEIISILNRLGHGISYSKLLEIETSLCMLKLSRSQEMSLCLPKHIVPHVHTTVAFDNIDRLEETLSGGGTSHRVNGIIVQPKVCGPFLPDKYLPLPNQARKRSLTEFIDDVHIPTYISGAKPDTPKIQKLQEIDYSEVRQTAWRNDLLYILCRLHGNQSQKVPGWTGFNILTSDKSSFGNRIGYLPTIDAPATNMSTINEVLNRALAIKNELHLDEIVCVFDQAIYAKAIEIKWKHMSKFDHLVLRMGTFHTACVMLSIIGKRFADAGLRDILIETDLVAEGSVAGVLEGRMYNRGIRTHKLVQEAMIRLAFEGFMPWLLNK